MSVCCMQRWKAHERSTDATEGHRIVAQTATSDDGGKPQDQEDSDLAARLDALSVRPTREGVPLSKKAQRMLKKANKTKVKRSS